MKTYSVVTDVSPSEQLGDDDDEIKVMALVFGLKSRKSFELVGEAYPEEDKRFTLKKWAGRPGRYKEGFVNHAKMLNSTGKVLLGSTVANNRNMRRVGPTYWQHHMGAFPKNPSSHNNKGKPRHRLGGYTVDGKLVDPFEVLEDHLAVCGWYAESLISAHVALENLNKDTVTLEVLIDRLPGDDDAKRAVLLKELCRKASNGKVIVVGVPKQSDTLQRELLADNAAGLGREVFTTGNDSIYGGGRAVFPVWRITQDK